MSEVVEQSEPSAGRTIFRNTIFGLGAQLALKGANFLFTVLIVRQLGGEQFGEYSIVLFWAGLFSVVGDLGITQYLAREIARNHEKTKELFWDTVVLRFILAVLACIVTVGAALLFTDYPPEIILGIAIFTSGYFFQSAIAALGSVLTGNERVDIVSVLETVMQVIFMILAGVVLLLGLPFVWLIIAGVINLPINLALQYWALRRNKLSLPRFKIHSSQWWNFLKAGLPFGLIQISLSFAFRFDTIILSTHVPFTEVGWYNAAYNLIFTLATVTRAFSNAVTPSLARLHAQNPNAIFPWYFRSVKFMLALGLPIAVGGMLLADKIVVTLYDVDFAPAAVALFILIWDLPIIMYTSFCGNMTTSIQREKNAARIYGSLGIINIVLNLILTPTFGIIGAAFATVLTDLVGAAQFYSFFRKEFGSGLGLNRLLRVVLSAAMMGIVVYLLRDFDLFFTVVIGGIVYLLILWFSGALTPEEKAQLIELWHQLTRKIIELLQKFVRKLMQVVWWVRTRLKHEEKKQA